MNSYNILHYFCLLVQTFDMFFSAVSQGSFVSCCLVFSHFFAATHALALTLKPWLKARPKPLNQQLQLLVKCQLCSVHGLR